MWKYSLIGAASRYMKAKIASTMRGSVITGNYKPYLGTISAPAGAPPDTAAAQAARVLVNYFSASQTALDNQLTATLALIPNDFSMGTHVIEYFL